MMDMVHNYKKSYLLEGRKLRMDTPKVFESEYRFLEILWEREPVNSSELVRLCNERLEWKKSTTYTVIKRLSERGVVKSEQAVVTSLYSREQLMIAQSREFVEKNFGGKLPQFVAAFAKGGKLDKKEIEELKQLINEMEV